MKGRELATNRDPVKQFVDMRLLLGLMLVTLAPAQDRSQARPMVISDRGIVARSQTLASLAGAQVLARGGSAIDAAIAANATLGVVEPERGGIGGDLFVIYYEASAAHVVTVTGDCSNQMDGGQAVIYNSATGVKYGASDPRKDGAAVPEPHPYYKN